MPIERCLHMKRAFFPWLLGILLIAGCATMQPLSKGVTLILKASVASGQYTKGEVVKNTRLSINHLDLELYPIVEGFEGAKLTARTIPYAQLDNPIVLANLKNNSTYRVKAIAYNSLGQIISTQDASSSVDIVVTTDDHPTLATIPVQLTDVPFNGQASSSLSVSPGGYSYGGAENLGLASQWVSTLAGNPGADINGFGTAAQFTSPYGLLVDNGTLYVADTNSHCVRAINTFTKEVTTLAGSTLGYADGVGTSAQFKSPKGLALANGKLYVSDYGDHRIREINLATKAVTTLAGGAVGFTDAMGTAAQFNAPAGMAIADGKLYVADYGNRCLRTVDLATKEVTTFAGNGTAAYVDAVGTDARFDFVDGVAIADGMLYVSDVNFSRIRKVNLATREVTTFAGWSQGTADGTGTAAQFTLPRGLAVADGKLYVADSSNARIRVIDIASQNVTTLAGSTSGYADAIGTSAQFNSLQGLAVADGTVYVAEGSRIRGVTLTTKSVYTVAGHDAAWYDAAGMAARFNQPNGLAFSNGKLYVSDTFNHRIRMIDLQNRDVSTLAGNTSGYTDADGTLAQFYSPKGLAVANGNLYIADAANYRIRVMDLATKEVTTFAGSTQGNTDAVGTAAQFNTLNGLAVADGKLYVADGGNYVVRQIDLATKEVTTLAGSTFGYTDAVGTAAQFKNPNGISVLNGKLYVADTSNYRVRVIDLATKDVTTLAGCSTSNIVDGTGTAAQFKGPLGILAANGKVYVSDGINAVVLRQAIRVIDLATTNVTTLGGGLSYGWVDGPGSASQFFFPNGLAMDDLGILYVADTRNNCIRKIL